MIKNCLLIISIFLTLIGQTGAQIITDRPDQTESSSTVPSGSFQLESGMLIGFAGDEITSSRQILLPTNLLRYGITHWMELRLVNQFEMLKNGIKQVEGISDMEIGLKIQLLKKENENKEIAFLSHLITPTGATELTNEKFGVSNKLSISHGINEKIGLAYNVGYNYLGIGNGDLTYSIALGIGINKKLGIYLEPYGTFKNLEDLIANIDTGLTYLLNQNLQLDFSFGTGINHTMNYISVGVSWLLLNDQ